MPAEEIRRVTRWFDLPVDLDEAARRFQAAGAEAPAVVPARPAATVMLVRDSTDTGSPTTGVEVFMLRRRSTMAFAPNRMVFPGGGVDERDSDTDLPWVGPTPDEWREWLGTRDEAEARELVVAAAREVFEECGVLLAGPDSSSVVGDTSGADWHAERDRLLAREQSFAEMLIRLQLVLRADLLHPWAHWVTPEFEGRRYDTRFFAAALPAGQRPDGRTTEADSAGWVRPEELLSQLEAGEVKMLAPTVVCVEAVAAASNVPGFLASAAPVARILPVVENVGSRARLRVDLPVREGEP